MRRRPIAFRLPLLLLLALLAFGAGAPATAQQAPEQPIEVSVTLDPPQATIGDLITVHVVVDHAGDIIVTPRPPRLAGGELVETAPPQTQRLRDGSERTTVEFVVQPFVLNRMEMGPVLVEWLREDSSSGTVMAMTPALRVDSVRATDDAELRGLKPQVTVPGAPPAWVRPAAAALGVVAAFSALVMAASLAWQRFRRAPVLPPLELAPEEVARSALDGLTGRRLLTEEDFQEFYGTLSVTVRRYLGARFQFKATALTTRQLGQRMPSAGIDRWQSRLVVGLLQRCDAAVYARRYPDPDSADHDLTMAYEIVELSRPRPPAAMPEAVPA